MVISERLVRPFRQIGLPTAHRLTIILADHVWKARPSDFYLTETSTMIIFGPMLVLVGIGFCCWLLFTLAVLMLNRKEKCPSGTSTLRMTCTRRPKS